MVSARMITEYFTALISIKYSPYILTIQSHNELQNCRIIILHKSKSDYFNKHLKRAARLDQFILLNKNL